MIETQVNPRQVNREFLDNATPRQPHRESSQVRRLLESFSELPNQVIRAKRRAIKITTRQISKEVKRNIATDNKIAQKVLGPRKTGGRNRVRGLLINPDFGLVWVGYNDIAMAYMGKFRDRFPHGVDFRGVNYPHAFVAEMESGHVGVFERASHLTHWSRGRKHTWQPNLPIQELALRLDNVAEAMEQSRRVETRRERLEVNFARELNYEVNVRGRNNP
jgi:hypothetical protein